MQQGMDQSFVTASPMCEGATDAHNGNGGEKGVRPFLRGIIAAIAGCEAVLTLHSEDGASPATIVADAEAVLSIGAREELARGALPLLRAATSNSSARSSWSTGLLDGSYWHVLRIPVASRCGSGFAVMHILFGATPLAECVPNPSQVEALRPIISAYLELLQQCRMMERRQTSLHRALDGLDLGVILIDRALRIAFANVSAHGLLATREHVRYSGHGFAATALNQGMALQVALSHAVAANADPLPGGRLTASIPTLALHAPDSRRPLIVAVVPALAPALEPDQVAAIVYLLDPRVDVESQLEPACRLYSLTPVEARLVCKLATGHTLQEAASATRVKEQTARSYLKHIFLKTGTHRQADLIRIMLSSMLPTERNLKPLFLT
jgi:DNA-binding CsgD family transcriptional regulator/PAS domain-containing protein